jgi:hypothetical protein
MKKPVISVDDVEDAGDGTNNGSFGAMDGDAVIE